MDYGYEKPTWESWRSKVLTTDFENGGAVGDSNSGNPINPNPIFGATNTPTRNPTQQGSQGQNRVDRMGSRVNPLEGWGQANLAAPRQQGRQSSRRPYTQQQQQGRNANQNQGRYGPPPEGPSLGGEARPEEDPKLWYAQGPQPRQPTQANWTLPQQQTRQPTQLPPQGSIHAATAPTGIASTYVSQFSLGSRARDFETLRPAPMPPNPRHMNHRRRDMQGREGTATLIGTIGKQWDDSSGANAMDYLQHPFGDDRFPPEGHAVDRPVKMKLPEKHPNIDAKAKDVLWYTFVRGNPSEEETEAITLRDAVDMMEVKGIEPGGEAKEKVQQALDSKTLWKVSSGQRGDVYFLEKDNEHVLGAALNVGDDTKHVWSLLGVAQKRKKGGYVLLAEKREG